MTIKVGASKFFNAGRPASPANQYPLQSIIPISVSQRRGHFVAAPIPPCPEGAFRRVSQNAHCAVSVYKREGLDTTQLLARNDDICNFPPPKGQYLCKHFPLLLKFFLLFLQILYFFTFYLGVQILLFLRSFHGERICRHFMLFFVQFTAITVWFCKIIFELGTPQFQLISCTIIVVCYSFAE